MARHETRSLFDEPAEELAAAGVDAPLAERMRPRSLDEFVGQADVVGEKSLLGMRTRPAQHASCRPSFSGARPGPVRRPSPG